MIKQRQNGRFPLLNNARISEEYLDKLIVPYTFAPVLILDDDTIEMVPMKFSLVAFLVAREESQIRHAQRASRIHQ